MVDLDSNPTKLIEIVAIGKQLLITRGALTTFSIANDVAKYFAIIPAMFMATYPALGALNIMRLHTPESAILAAVIFNALIIIALVPLALRGVQVPAAGRAAPCCGRNLLIYGARRHRRAVSGHLADRPAAGAVPSRVRASCRPHLLPAFRLTLVLTVLTGVIYPAVVTGIAQVVFPAQANGSLADRRRPGRRLAR